MRSGLAYALPLLFVVVPACKDKATADADAAPSATVSASAAPVAAPKSTRPTGTPATLAQLEAIKLPVPPKAPKAAKWVTAAPPISEDGDKRTSLKDGEKYVMSIRIIDCRAPKLAPYDSKPITALGEMTPCFAPGKEQLKTFALERPNDVQSRLRVGNMAIVGTASDPKIFPQADVEAYIGALDLASIAKM